MSVSVSVRVYACVCRLLAKAATRQKKKDSDSSRAQRRPLELPAAQKRAQQELLFKFCLIDECPRCGHVPKSKAEVPDDDRTSPPLVPPPRSPALVPPPRSPALVPDQPLWQGPAEELAREEHLRECTDAKAHRRHAAKLAQQAAVREASSIGAKKQVRHRRSESGRARYGGEWRLCMCMCVWRICTFVTAAVLGMVANGVCGRRTSRGARRGSSAAVAQRRRGCSRMPNSRRPSPKRASPLRVGAPSRCGAAHGSVAGSAAALIQSRAVLTVALSRVLF
jgi:hypothetical protein